MKSLQDVEKVNNLGWLSCQTSLLCTVFKHSVELFRCLLLPVAWDYIHIKPYRLDSWLDMGHLMHILLLFWSERVCGWHSSIT